VALIEAEEEKRPTRARERKVVFFVEWAVLSYLVMLLRGFYNASNVQRFGPQADWRSNLPAAAFGSIAAALPFVGLATFLVGMVLR